MVKKTTERLLKGVGWGVATTGALVVGTAIGMGGLMLPIAGAGALLMASPFAEKGSPMRPYKRKTKRRK